MDRPKYETCRHSTGHAWSTLVEVTSGCPKYGIAEGKLYVPGYRCRRCRYWEPRKAGYINQDFEDAVKEMTDGMNRRKNDGINDSDSAE